jgi:carbon storage regulator
MLVLRRKIGESIILDGVISVSVLAVEGERVKIGITAPPEVTIVREELLKNTPDLPKPNAAAVTQ